MILSGAGTQDIGSAQGSAKFDDKDILSNFFLIDLFMEQWVHAHDNCAFITLNITNRSPGDTIYLHGNLPDKSLLPPDGRESVKPNMYSYLEKSMVHLETQFEVDKKVTIVSLGVGWSGRNGCLRKLVKRIHEKWEIDEIRSYTLDKGLTSSKISYIRSSCCISKGNDVYLNFTGNVRIQYLLKPYYKNYTELWNAAINSLPTYEQLRSSYESLYIADNYMGLKDGPAERIFGKILKDNDWTLKEDCTEYGPRRSKRHRRYQDESICL